MNLLRFISRLLTGALFIFSGTVKAMDPLGSAYKFQDYFHAFNLGFLLPLALPLAILLATAEFIAGFSVLTGYRFRTGRWAVLILMIIFTPLTLVLAVTNPVSDCGCFGDAIHLTNWQTFGKNIAILFLVLILFSDRRKLRHQANKLIEWTWLGTVSALFIIFSLLNLRYLPLIDFLPYRVGKNIQEQMKIPEDKPVDQYETTFIYEKDGVTKEFTLDNYPADDTTWKFIDQKSVLVKKGFQPPIHDFTIVLSSGEDITVNILENRDLTLLMISKKLEDADPGKLQAGYELGRNCITGGIGFYVLTASGPATFSSSDSGITFCNTDETTLKTMVRSNPGYLLLKNGTIIGKWSWATVPATEKFLSYASGKPVSRMDNKSPVLIVYTSCFSAMILLLVLISLIGKNRRS
jgi:uncharacterized membrane protein YphA (DoxX/SURF4 family)